MKLRKWLPALAAALLSTVASAATVTELKPSEVAAFVARHEYAIVQVTSPDRKCGYCIGADKKFDQFAAAAGERKFAFARVQHTPWRAIPDFGKLMTVYGVPEQIVFRAGKEIGQVTVYRTDAPTFYANVDALLVAPPKPPVAATPKPPPPPLTAEENAALRLMVRRDLLQGVLDACGKRFPAHAGKYRDAIARWQEPRMDELNKGTRALLTGNADMRALAGEEQQVLKDWQANDLGISMTKKVEAADCNRFAEGIATLR